MERDTGVRHGEGNAGRAGQAVIIRDGSGQGFDAHPDSGIHFHRIGPEIGGGAIPDQTHIRAGTDITRIQNHPGHQAVAIGRRHTDLHILPGRKAHRCSR